MFHVSSPSSLSVCPLSVHHGGAPGAVRVPDQQTSFWWTQSGCGRQDNGAQGNPLPFQPRDCLCCSLFQGDRNIISLSEIRQKSQENIVKFRRRLCEYPHSKLFNLIQFTADVQHQTNSSRGNNNIRQYIFDLFVKIYFTKKTLLLFHSCLLIFTWKWRLEGTDRAYWR